MALACVGMAVAAPAATTYTFKPVQVYGGGYVDAVVFHPAQANLIYARTDMGGAYRWNNATATWIPLTDFLNRDQADYMGDLALALDPNDVNKVYLLTGKYTQSWAGNGALLASSDQGATWSVNALPFKVGGNEDGRGAGERLAVDPNLGSILFAGSNASGLYKSVNSGVAWAAVGAFPSTNITFVTFDKSSSSTGTATPTIYIGVNATANNLYKSTNGGTTWALVAGQPSGVIPMRSAWGNSGRLYITYADALGPNGVTAGSVQRLDTSTGTWTNLNAPTGQGGWCGVGVRGGASDQVVVATLDRWWPSDEVYLSTNSGGAWSAKLTGATMDETQAPWVASSTPHWLSDISQDPFDANQAFFVTGYGVYRTQNLTAATPTWTFASRGIEQTVPLQLISPPSGAANLLTAMGDVDGFRHLNLDAPPTQRLQPEVGTTLAIAYAEALPTKMVKAYNAGPPSNYGGYSTNGGINWTLFPAYPGGTSGGGTASIAVSADGNNIVWCPAGAACSRSTTNGSAWTAVSGGIPASLEPIADRVNSNKFYAFDWNTGQCWVSSNGGATFSVGATGLGTLPSYLATDASLKATLGKEGDLWLCNGSNGLFHSTNSGASFTKLGTVSAAYEIATGLGPSVGAYPSLYLFGIVGGTRGFYRSDDSGVTWVRINDDQHQYGSIHDFSGDPRIYGRLYFCAEGRGALYGDLPSGASPTPSRTATRTATRSATPTATSSASPTATRTQTASATRSPSPSSSPTLSPSATALLNTATATRTATRTVTPSATTTVTTTATRTATPSATPLASSATASPSPSATPTVTRSATATASPSASATATPSVTISPTRTRSASSTPTATDVPPGSSPTVTSTPSPSASPSLTRSPSPTATWTATRSATASASPSFTATVSASHSPTLSPSVTISLGSPTLTATPTASSSVTPASSPTETASATRSATATTSPSASISPSPSFSPSVTALVASPSATPTGTPSASPSLTATRSPTPTLTASPTGTSTRSVSPTVTPPATATASPSATLTATPVGPLPTPTATEFGQGTLQVLSLVAFPNPNPQDLRLLMDGPADGGSLQVYSAAMVKVAEMDLGVLNAGWNQVRLPANVISLPRGLYFARVQALQGQRHSPWSAPLRWVLLP